MSEWVHYLVRDRIAILTIDNPPVNALGPGVWEALDAAVARANADAAVDAIVLTGAGWTFVAGADIKVFDTLKTRGDSLARSGRNHAVLRRMEDVTKPLVAAIHGNAFGGGLEVAMGCHYRVATSDAKLGQPEVRLGLIPGAGGTQRLPRLCGIPMAIEMCTSGRPIPAPEALEAGLVDAIAAGDVVETAMTLALARAAVGATRRARDIALTEEAVNSGVAACEQAEARLAEAHVLAPWRAVRAIHTGLVRGFDEGSLHERELFADCVVSTESRALRHLFFAERAAAKLPSVFTPGRTPEVRRAAIVGAGTMGVGIAMTYASAGIPVLLKDVDEKPVQQGVAAMRRNFQSAVDKGRMTAEALECTMALVTPTVNYDGFGEADIIVEAVFENLDLKKSIFEEIGRVARPDCILASNTSTLDIDAFATATLYPEQVVGHHFFSPAHVMKLLEIVRGKRTSAQVLASSVALGKRLGKVPVVVGNCFGFVANRMLAYYMREAYLLLEEGASVAQIDGALIEFGMPVGPFGMQDIAGLDVGARIRQHLRALGRTRAEGPESAVPDRLFEMGRYGQKTGAGWYRYESGSRQGTPDPLVETIAAQEAAKRGTNRRAITSDEIVARTMSAVINEGARILQEGFAARAGDIDVIYCYGFGFPRYRGGPMFYADAIGLPSVLQRIREYRATLGSHWTPAPLLERLVVDGRRLSDEAAPLQSSVPNA